MNRVKHTDAVNAQNTINLLPPYLRRMTLKEVGEILRKKDKRTAERWCRDNNVTIFPDRGGKFVLADDFEMGCKRQVKTEMKKKLGSGWETILSTHDVQPEINSSRLLKPTVNTSMKKNNKLSKEAN